MLTSVATATTDPKIIKLTRIIIVFYTLWQVDTTIRAPARVLLTTLDQAAGVFPASPGQGGRASMPAFLLRRDRARSDWRIMHRTTLLVVRLIQMHPSLPLAAQIGHTPPGATDQTPCALSWCRFYSEKRPV